MIFWKRRRRKTAEEPVKEAKQPAEAEKRASKRKKSKQEDIQGSTLGLD